MAKLHFDLVSPERLLISAEVDQVDVPGSEGDFGVMANHAPVMTNAAPRRAHDPIAGQGGREILRARRLCRSDAGRPYHPGRRGDAPRRTRHRRPRPPHQRRPGRPPRPLRRALLWRASASGTIFPNFPEDVTDELRAEAARILGEDMPPLDELLENRFTIMKAAVRKCWDLMSKTARTTDMELSLYEGFHGALEEMELVPQSPAVLELLGVDAETFRSVDQAHALNFVYHQGTVLTDIGAEVAMLYAAIAENDRAETAVSQALVQEFINAREHLGGNCQSLINYAARVSQLDNAQIQSYISGRLDREASRIGAGDAGQFEDKQAIRSKKVRHRWVY